MSKREDSLVGEGMSISDATSNNEANEPTESKADAGSEMTLSDEIARAFVKGGNHAMVFISDNPDGSAYAAMLRGDNGVPEMYVYHLDGGILNPVMKKLVLKALKKGEEHLGTDEGIYDYMATVVGAANCSGGLVPGVTPVRAIVGIGMPMILASFTATRRVSDAQTVFLKRSRNIARNYYNIAVKNKDKSPARHVSGAGVGVVSDERDEDALAFFGHEMDEMLKDLDLDE